MKDRRRKRLKIYETVIAAPRSEFTESALVKAATLSYGLAKYDTALAYFSTLEATAENRTNVTEACYGKMKSNYMMKNYEGALTDAGKLLAVEKLTDQMKLEAMMIRANSYYFSDELPLAKSEYKKIAALSQGEAGAEATFNAAEIEFKLSDTKSAEKTALN